MYNRVVLVGNLTRDIELRYLPSGTAVATTGIATNRKFKTANGEQKDEVMFIDITFFGRSAEIANQYLRKGSKVLVEGRLILEQWIDQMGQKRSKHSIRVDNMQMLDSKADSQNNQGGYDNSYTQNYQQPQQNYNPQQSQNNYQQPVQPQAKPTQTEIPKVDDIPEIDIDDDNLPF